MNRQYDVISAGDYCLDLIFTGLPSFPKLGAEIVSTGFEMLTGGTFNTVAALHRLGVHVGWAADFGNDRFSQFALEEIHREGIDDALFVHHNRPLRKITVAASYPEERAFIAFYDPDPPVPAAVRALGISSGRAFHIPGIYCGPFLEIGLKLVHLKSMKVIIDGNSPEEFTLDTPGVRRLLAQADVFIPNAREACKLTGKSSLFDSASVLEQLCPLLVIKDGPNGAYAWHSGQMIHSPGLDLRPVDTTGAGDCFNAGFIKAWLDERPLEECLRWGNVVGGLSTLASGATRYRIDVQMVRDHLASN